MLVLFSRPLFFLVLFLGISISSHSALAENDVQHVSATEAAESIRQQSDIVILDVRTPEEFQQGHLEGAINIDFHAADFQDQIRALSPRKTYLLHCRTGNRSGRTLPLMQEAGIQKIIHMDGGIESWRAVGLKTTTD